MENEGPLPFRGPRNADRRNNLLEVSVSFGPRNLSYGIRLDVYRNLGITRWFPRHPVINAGCNGPP